MITIILNGREDRVASLLFTYSTEKKLRVKL